MIIFWGGKFKSGGENVSKFHEIALRGSYCTFLPILKSKK